MNFDHIITDKVGLIHLIFSIVALATGTLVLGLTKGTKTHKKIGYIYSASMFIVLVTAFSMYNLFGTWGIFHWAAVVSTITLALGLIPILTKRPKKNYISLHFSFMYWSVIGLYGAFMAEFFVRFPKKVVDSGIPNEVFYNMTGIAVAITMGLGAYFFINRIPKWKKNFRPEGKK
jgi:uncharacterized membrane protein